MGSRVQAQQLWHMGLAVPRHVKSSQTRDQTCVPCIGRWVLNHCPSSLPPGKPSFISYFVYLSPLSFLLGEPGYGSVDFFTLSKDQFLVLLIFFYCFLTLFYLFPLDLYYFLPLADFRFVCSSFSNSCRCTLCCLLDIFLEF